jgi:hypothetical protein
LKSCVCLCTHPHVSSQKILEGVLFGFGGSLLKVEDTILFCDISGFYGGEYEDGCLLGCCAV